MKRIIFWLSFIVLSLGAKSQEIIQMKRENGIFKIPCMVNGLRLKMIFDTGASFVCISEQQAIMMLENDYLTLDDIKGNSTTMIADGSIVDNTKVILREIKIGNRTINNVEAVIVHSQNAPLLLGQSAIKKLGNVTIKGDKLYIDDLASASSQQEKEYSEEELDEMLDESCELFDKESYALAVSKLEILASYNYLDSYGLFLLAYSYLRTEEYAKAINVFIDNEKKYKQDNPKDVLAEYYKLIAVCYERFGDQDNTIAYFRLAINTAEDPFYRLELQSNLARSYREIGLIYRSRSEMQSCIDGYCNLMQLSATDCWNKNYKDDFLASCYAFLSLSTSDDFDRDRFRKYQIIAAAWGKKSAIENCEDLEYNYLSKPSEYVY